MYFKVFLISLLASCASVVLAQKGYIRGIVYDDDSGEYLPGVTVVLEGTTAGTITDLDGAFNLHAEPGKYNLRISFISYEGITFEDLNVHPGEVIFLGEIRLREAVLAINEVTITANEIRDTETAMFSIKRKSPAVLDGISAGAIKRIGDSNVAGALKRVSGVSVSGGKYVYVRGLGDRYTKSMLNGVDVPGLDPDRNTMQMDIFPTSVVNNIIVHKTFSPEVPADFTGGAVNIELKDFPNKAEGGLNIKLGYNPGSHFNSNYLTYKGGSTDFLGFDDGTRSIPATENIPFFAEALGNPDGKAGTRYKEVLNSFNKNMAAMQATSMADAGFGFFYGNQKPKEKYTLGYNFAFSYKNETDFYKESEYGKYGLEESSIYEMSRREYQAGSYGENSVLISALAGLAIKTDKSKYLLKLLNIQNGESKAGIFDFVGSDQGSDFRAFQHVLDYSQRSLTHLLLGGDHIHADKEIKVNWKLASTYSTISDPDVRFTRYEVFDDLTVGIGTEVGFPARIWRNLNESNTTGAMDLSRGFDFLGNTSKFHFGTMVTYKYRNYIIRNFLINPRGNFPLTGNPDELFSAENLWIQNGDIGSGTTYETPFLPTNPNMYNASSLNLSAYVSGELAITPRFKNTIGFRLENYMQYYTGSDQQRENVLDNEKVLSSLKIFPSINLVYHLTDLQNLRVSYNQTVARPSFKELSYAEIFDPITGRTFVGGFHKDGDAGEGTEIWSGKLVSTDIQNFDLRWERYGRDGQLLSFSSYFKLFKNPIEIVQFTKQVGAFQPRNVGDGRSLGVELELRQDMRFISEILSGWRLSANVTLNRSRIEMSNTEYQSRAENARDGQIIERYRAMAGQAPYVVNGGISFTGGKEGFWRRFDAGIYYNVQAATLNYVGAADRPDIYSKSFHSLNFNSSIKFGHNDKMALSLKVENLMNQQIEQVYKSYKAKDQLFEKRAPGILSTIKFSYIFN